MFSTAATVRPEWLKARAVSVQEPLTIFPGLECGAVAGGPRRWLMNLNLDDRLAPDAVEVLETRHPSAARDRGGRRVEHLLFASSETDAVEPCYPAERLPYCAEWPPPPRTRTRLGSGTGDRST